MAIRKLAVYLEVTYREQEGLPTSIDDDVLEIGTFQDAIKEHARRHDRFVAVTEISCTDFGEGHDTKRQ